MKISVFGHVLADLLHDVAAVLDLVERDAHEMRGASAAARSPAPWYAPRPPVAAFGQHRIEQSRDIALESIITALSISNSS
jgi:hypothetical protein